MQATVNVPTRNSGTIECDINNLMFFYSLKLNRKPEAWIGDTTFKEAAASVQYARQAKTKGESK